MGTITRGIGALVVASSIAACSDQPSMPQAEATKAFETAEYAGWDTSDRAWQTAYDEDPLITNADLSVTCDAGGGAHVVGGFFLDGATAYHSVYDVSFDGCAASYGTVDGDIRTSDKQDTDGLWIASVEGSVVVHDSFLAAKYPDGASCDIDVHIVLQDVPGGKLVTYSGEACGWDAPVLFPTRISPQ